MPERLHPADIEAIALRVVELQGEREVAHWVDAKTAAHALGVEPDWVYRHADELGGKRLPSPKGQGRLRFNLATLLDQGDCTAGSRPKATESRSAKRNGARRRQAIKAGDVELLPIRGDRAA